MNPVTLIQIMDGFLYVPIPLVMWLVEDKENSEFKPVIPHL